MTLFDKIIKLFIMVCAILGLVAFILHFTDNKRTEYYPNMNPIFNEKSEFLISFSLWGAAPCYNWGALENALAAAELFPGWICRYYIGKGVNKQMLRKLKALKNTEIIMMKTNKLGHGNGTMWRFTPCFETHGIVIVRDTDSILNPRDKAVVAAWLKSDKDFHIIRDHAHGHNSRIMGGYVWCTEWNPPKY